MGINRSEIRPFAYFPGDGLGGQLHAGWSPVRIARQVEGLVIGAFPGLSKHLQKIDGRHVRTLVNEDFVVAASTANLVGDFPCCGSVSALIRLWDRAAGPDRFELRRGVLAGLGKMLDAEQGT